MIPTSPALSYKRDQAMDLTRNNMAQLINNLTAGNIDLDEFALLTYIKYWYPHKDRVELNTTELAEKIKKPFDTICYLLTSLIFKGYVKRKDSTTATLVLSREHIPKGADKPKDQSEEDTRKAAKELGYNGVTSEVAAYLAKTYSLRYIMVQCRQINRDALKHRFNNGPAILVWRIRSGHETEVKL